MEEQSPNVKNETGESSDDNLLITFIKKCKILKDENSNLRECIKEQQIRINELTRILRTLNSSSDIDSSESQNERSTSLSLSSASKSTKIQRVTPTKREVTRAGKSSSTTPANDSQLTRIIRRSPRRDVTRSTDTPVLNRNNSSSFASTPSNASAARNNSRQEPTPILTPLSRTHNLSNTLPQTRQTRRRLFNSEDMYNENSRPVSSPVIEHLNISPIKDERWLRSLPPRMHLERNRPDFISRLEARQDIIRTAALKRAEIGNKKLNAARAVVAGRKSIQSVQQDLFADTTKIRAFYESDMKMITYRNIKKTELYRKRLTQNITSMNQAANRIITQTHNIRTRSVSQLRLGQNTV